ncbi:MAG: ATP-binding protein [Microcoleus sp.]
MSIQNRIPNPHQTLTEVATGVEHKLKERLLPHPNYLNGRTRKFNHLNISGKICCGYALALAVAIGGTAIGMLVGDRYYQKNARIDSITAESHLLSELQATLLQAQISQQRLAIWLKEPKIFNKKYQQLAKDTALLKSLLAEVNFQRDIAQTEGLQDFLNNYESILTDYIQTLETAIAQIEAWQKKPIKASTNEKLLSNLAKDPIGFQVDSATNNLAEIILLAQQEEEAAQEALASAQVLRSQIITVSMILSALIAGILAHLTNRAIVRPISAVTNIAQRVTEESNFELQVPFTGNDEVGVLATSLNQLIAKVNNLLNELKAEQEMQVMQNEKMATLGRMLAGVAHEINNPINFIYANIEPARNYVEDILQLLETYETEIPNPPPPVLACVEEIDIEFAKEDLMKIFHSMQVGAERAKAIALSLKDFSRLDAVTPSPVDLHACLDSSLLILNNRIKHQIEVVRNYGDIPLVEGYMGLLYQVFVNVLSNAIDAVEEQVKITKNTSETAAERSQTDCKTAEVSSFLPRITISTELMDGDSTIVRIADNGIGIPPASQAKMFETFFTTKPRGTGTGLGLAIGREIIVNKHGGTINCWSEVGKGTEFTIVLPIKH